MDDKLSIQPSEHYSDLVAQLNDPVWLKQNAEIEGDGWVEAGNGLQPYVACLKKLSDQDMRKMKEQVSVLSMLLPVLRDWMVSWELGASFEAAYIEAQTLLFHHIQQAAATQESWVKELASAYEQGTRAEHPPARLQKRLAEILTQENWQALAKVATRDMEQRILQHAQIQAELPATV